MIFYIREKSLIARIAAWKLRAESVAIVTGRTIHLHNTSKEKFLADTRWLRHELVHVKQYRQYGYTRFILQYLLESWKNGYANNRYEVEARQGEQDASIIGQFTMIE